MLISYYCVHYWKFHQFLLMRCVAACLTPPYIDGLGIVPVLSFFMIINSSLLYVSEKCRSHRHLLEEGGHGPLPGASHLHKRKAEEPSQGDLDHLLVVLVQVQLRLR